MLSRLVQKIALCTVLVCLFASCTPNVLAQSPKTMKISIQWADNTPRRLLVVRGTNLQFRGNLSADAGEVVVSIKMGDVVVASGTFSEQWQLEWDTTKVKEGIKFVWVYMGRKNQVPAPVAKYNADFVGVNPFTVSAVQVEGQPGKVQLRFTRDSSFAVVRYRILLDNDEKEIVVDGSKDTAIIDLSSAIPGLRRLRTTAELDTFHIPLDDVTVTLPHQIDVETVDSEKTSTSKQIALQLRPKDETIYTEFEGYLNGKSIGITKMSDGIPLTLRLKTEALRTGTYQLYLRAVTADKRIFLTPRSSMAIVNDFTSENPKREKEREQGEKQTSQSVHIPTADTVEIPIECLAGRIAITEKTTVRLTGKFENQQNNCALSLLIGKEKHPITQNSGTFRFVLIADKLNKGENLVKVRVDRPNGTGQIVAQAYIVVYSKPPVRLVTPTTEKDWVKPFVLSLEAQSDFQPKSAQFYKGTERLLINFSGIAVEWDVTKESVKDFSLWAEVESETGERYQINPVIVTVPQRVRLATSSKPLEVTPKARTLQVDVKFIEGLNPKSVEFLLDGKSVEILKKPPFDRTNIVVAQIPSGQYRLSVQVEDENGAKYKSDAAEITIKNIAIDRQKVADAKLLRAQEGENERITKEWDKFQLAGLRRRIVGQIPSQFRRGTGTIGRANGLSVLVVTTTINGIPVEQRHYGKPLIVECFIREGEGRISLQARGDGYAQDSVQQAAFVMKRLVEKKGYTQDWSRVDITIDYSDAAEKIGGNSAGIANTTAMMSMVLGLPIDNSVAMTGAIAPDGSVLPVGGIIFKANSALSDPKIKTLILPNHPANDQELDILYRIKPELFSSKRIIFVSHIEEVLRQALIGYDEEKLRYAEGKLISAMNSFVSGDDAVALSDLRTALKFTPENHTLRIWISAIEDAKASREKSKEK